MAHHQQGDRRTSNRPGLLKMLRLSSNTPTVVPLGEEELAESVDEPPDDILSPLPTSDRFLHDHKLARTATRPVHDRRESLLTRAIRATSNPPSMSQISPTSFLRGLSTTSSHSTASTAELTSDDHSTPPHSATPSPPSMHSTLVPIFSGKKVAFPSLTTPVTEEQPATPTQTSPNEAAVEKSLGRKRCIMFACGAEKKKEPEPVKPVETPVEAPKRKCMLTFMCPSRNEKKQDLAAEILDTKSGSDSQARKLSTDSAFSASDKDHAPLQKLKEAKAPIVTPPAIKTVQSFHEFGSSMDEADAWVEKPIDQGRRLTLSDCLRKEMAIRQLGEEAEAEADAEAEEQNDNDDDDENVEDDFASSDNSSDGGNESDDEEGFADSDDESNADSDDLFWTTTAQTSMTNISQMQSLSRNRSAASSIESSTNLSRFHTNTTGRHSSRRIRPKAPKMGPATPELPDSTDFVCGTLDEDRPLEAAYIACREARKREKHIAIPQDIDPSFPTSDPDSDDEEEDDEDEAATYGSGIQIGGNMHTPHYRSRRDSNVKSSVPLSPKQKSRSPLSPQHAGKRRVLRSPPPPLARRGTARSPPPPRRLFGHSPSRLRSPPPSARLRSPRGSPTVTGMPLGITINRLAQRPGFGRTASLPHSPNPFFRNWQLKRVESNLESQGTTPGVTSETLRPEMHVRGPVDIVIGLEKKRQKRKEKFWRQHCRKAAKEALERKPLPGRGAERMKELGLGCAERARQYGLQTQEPMVISM